MRARSAIPVLSFALMMTMIAVACSAPIPSSSSSGDLTGAGSKDSSSKRKSASDDSDESVSDDNNKKRGGGSGSGSGSGESPLEPTNNAPASRDAGRLPRPGDESDDRPAGGASSSSSSTGGAPTCNRDADCSLGFICQRNACELGCRGNADCPTNEHCDINRGQCAVGSPVSQGNQCVIDENCPLGRICENGRCILGCRSSFDCPLNQSCIVGFCFG